MGESSEDGVKRGVVFQEEDPQFHSETSGGLIPDPLGSVGDDAQVCGLLHASLPAQPWPGGPDRIRRAMAQTAKRAVGSSSSRRDHCFGVADRPGGRLASTLVRNSRQPSTVLIIIPSL
jgi:hypothetical protein